MRRDLFQSMSSSSPGFFFCKFIGKNNYQQLKIKQTGELTLGCTLQTMCRLRNEFDELGITVVKLENLFIIWTDIVFLCSFVGGLYLVAMIDVALDVFLQLHAGILKCNRFSCLLHFKLKFTACIFVRNVHTVNIVF